MPPMTLESHILDEAQTKLGLFNLGGLGRACHSFKRILTLGCGYCGFGEDQCEATHSKCCSSCRLGPVQFLVQFIQNTWIK